MIVRQEQFGRYELESAIRLIYLRLPRRAPAGARDTPGRLRVVRVVAAWGGPGAREGCPSGTGGKPRARRDAIVIRLLPMPTTRRAAAASERRPMPARSKRSKASAASLAVPEGDDVQAPAKLGRLAGSVAPSDAAGQGSARGSAARQSAPLVTEGCPP